MTSSCGQGWFPQTPQAICSRPGPQLLVLLEPGRPSAGRGVTTVSVSDLVCRLLCLSVPALSLRKTRIIGCGDRSDVGRCYREATP